jgi:hypothetical protein
MENPERILNKTESEGNIIERLVADAKKEEFPNRFVYELKYGRKNVTLSYFFETREAITHIDSIGTEEDKKEGETSILYEAVKKILQDLSDKKGQEIEYKIETRNGNIREWALTKGKEIFKWESEPEKRGELTLIFKTVIRPDNKR